MECTSTPSLWSQKSNHFLNGPADTEEKLVSPPGAAITLGGQVAQLRKNLSSLSYTMKVSQGSGKK